jgi:hypothetical protein
MESHPLLEQYVEVVVTGFKAGLLVLAQIFP